MADIPLIEVRLRVRGLCDNSHRLRRGTVAAAMGVPIAEPARTLQVSPRPCIAAPVRTRKPPATRAVIAVAAASLRRA